MKCYSRISLLVFALIISFGASACKKDEAKEDSKENVNKTELLELVNQIRGAKCNCGGTVYKATSALVWNDKLKEAAQLHAQDMFDKSYFDHVSPDDKSTLATRLAIVNYNYATAAENIANGHETESIVVAGWKNSPGHCVNMMNPNVTEMGVAKVGPYWVMVLGKPLPTN